ncbi:MAG: ribonuclease HII [Oscillospiraceae bacterium]|nr:ribonuclease HII [Oscillospiraceae bacterium]
MKEELLLRRQAMLDFDEAFRTEYSLLCGVDEAGRGPLAGDVYAAAVILPENCNIEGLDDSKKISEKRREKLFKEIQEKAICWNIATASVAEIEKLNILKASLLAMKRAVEGLTQKPDYALIDGNQRPALSIPFECLVKGDAKSASIAAASILAKVARDRYMTEQAKLYPDYAFEKHKGYGTEEHRKRLQQFGACPIHRPSFLKKIL